jgi:hypothetical protein
MGFACSANDTGSDEFVDDCPDLAGYELRRA